MAGHSKPDSLGETKPVYQLVRDELELPKTRKEIVDAVASILNMGGVQKLVIEVNEPIRFARFVQAQGEAPVELPGEDLFATARNAEMVDLGMDVNGPKAILHAFHLLSKRNLKARALFLKDYDTLQRWVGLEKDKDELDENHILTIYGVEFFEHPEVPTGTALLMAVDPTNVDRWAIELTVRIPVNMPKRKAK